MAVFGNTRRLIAQKTNSPFADQFGLRRDEDYLTLLDRQYLAWGKKIRTFFSEILAAHREGDVLGDRESEVRFRTFDWNECPTEEDRKIVDVYEEMAGVRFDSDSRFIIATIFWKDRDEWVAVTDSIWLIGSQLLPMIKHMPPNRIPVFMRQVQTIFDRVANSQKLETPRLIQEVVEFRYRFSLIMPFKRGSAAIGEWFESTMTRVSGSQIERPEEICGDLQAFVDMTLEKFKENYSATFRY